jgi:hypothetical protein
MDELCLWLIVHCLAVLHWYYLPIKESRTVPEVDCLLAAHEETMQEVVRDETLEGTDRL